MANSVDDVHQTQADYMANASAKDKQHIRRYSIDAMYVQRTGIFEKSSMFSIFWKIFPEYCIKYCENKFCILGLDIIYYFTFKPSNVELLATSHYNKYQVMRLNCALLFMI